MTETSNSSLKILLVDDEEVVHKTIGDYLRDSGKIIDNAYDGEDALSKIAENDFDLALVDIRMPGMDGITLLGKISEIKPELAKFYWQSSKDVQGFASSSQ